MQIKINDKVVTPPKNLIQIFSHHVLSFTTVPVGPKILCTVTLSKKELRATDEPTWLHQRSKAYRLCCTPLLVSIKTP